MNKKEIEKLLLGIREVYIYVPIGDTINWVKVSKLEASRLMLQHGENLPSSVINDVMFLG